MTIRQGKAIYLYSTFHTQLQFRVLFKWFNKIRHDENTKHIKILSVITCLNATGQSATYRTVASF